MNDEEQRVFQRIIHLRNNFGRMMDLSMTLSELCATTGLTNEHLVAARSAITGDAKRQAALGWALANSATPCEMVAWYRLQHD